jgi:hypothetical protein
MKNWQGTVSNVIDSSTWGGDTRLKVHEVDDRGLRINTLYDGLMKDFKSSPESHM